MFIILKRDCSRYKYKLYSCDKQPYYLINIRNQKLADEYNIINVQLEVSNSVLYYKISSIHASIYNCFEINSNGYIYAVTDDHCNIYLFRSMEDKIAMFACQHMQIIKPYCVKNLEFNNKFIYMINKEIVCEFKFTYKADFICLQFIIQMYHITYSKRKQINSRRLMLCIDVPDEEFYIKSMITKLYSRDDEILRESFVEIIPISSNIEIGLPEIINIDVETTQSFTVLSYDAILNPNKVAIHEIIDD